MRHIYPFNKVAITNPNLFLIGAPKCGTTSLAWMLGQHPDILLSTPKEPNFIHKSIFREGLEYYSKTYFPGFNGEQYRLDASQGYMLGRYVPERIKQFSKNPKFIFILREPLTRAYSDWKAWTRYMRNGIMANTFEGEIKRNLQYMKKNRFMYEWELDGNTDSYGYLYDPYIIERSLYSIWVNLYISNFTRKNVFVCEYNSLKDYQRLCNKIFKWLNISHYSVENKSKMVSHEHKTHSTILSKCNSKYVDSAYMVMRNHASKLKELNIRDEITGKHFEDIWYGD